MKKWVGPLLSILLIALLFLILFASDIFKTITNKKEKMEGHWIVLTQDTEKEEKGGKGDPYSIALLKQIREKVEAWLKSLNEKIEREDITRFKVRFYEFLRNILEWVKEKLDAKIESLEEKKPEEREKGGLFRETHQRIFSFSKIG